MSDANDLGGLSPVEKWQLIEQAWEKYCHGGARAFDWDYDSRDLMRDLTEHGAFGACSHPEPTDGSGATQSATEPGSGTDSA